MSGKRSLIVLWLGHDMFFDLGHEIVAVFDTKTQARRYIAQDKKSKAEPGGLPKHFYKIQSVDYLGTKLFSPIERKS